MLFIIVFIAGLTIWMGGGGIPGVDTYLGSAQGRPAEWFPEIFVSNFPNAVTLGDMELESGGVANSTNYNCTGRRSSDGVECSLAYGTAVKTLSVDAGLMQINSGGWPDTPKWKQVFGPGGDPYDPKKNIAEGIRELNADTAKCGGYLQEGLSAYNSGSCQSGAGLTYAGKVLANITAYEGGPEVSAWATGNYTGQANNFLWWHWGAHQWRQPYPKAQTWLLVSGSYAIPNPPNAPQEVKWAPPPLPDHPATMFEWANLSPPTKVTINGQEAQLDPAGAPLIPGQDVWGIQTNQTGSFTATAEWDWEICDKYGHCTKYHRDATSNSVTILPAQH
ncbi:MAG: transglycosylase SLT domain-containing protein [Peptococcaceae bacterium]|nr:transglycosylase SLT domain-containing protein [Peptococcaceae bacterium]